LEKRENGQVYRIDRGNERKNVGIPKEILRCLCLLESMIEFVGDRPGHDFRHSLSCDETHRLGWRAGVVFEQGFEKVIDWYKANVRWWSPAVHRSAATVAEGERGYQRILWALCFARTKRD
jgi:dTDP-glucose 4,6-dehydratase